MRFVSALICISDRLAKRVLLIDDERRCPVLIVIDKHGFPDSTLLREVGPFVVWRRGIFSFGVRFRKVASQLRRQLQINLAKFVFDVPTWPT